MHERRAAFGAPDTELHSRELASTSIGVSFAASRSIGQAQLDSLAASAVRAAVSGAGLIAVTATESLDASVPGSGAIVYGGNPNDVTKTVTGSGAITQR